MADDGVAEGINAELQQEMYIPVRTLGRGAFGEAVLYRKIEVSKHLIVLLFYTPVSCFHRIVFYIVRWKTKNSVFKAKKCSFWFVVSLYHIGGKIWAHFRMIFDVEKSSKHKNKHRCYPLKDSFFHFRGGSTALIFSILWIINSICPHETFIFMTCSIFHRKSAPFLLN